MTALHFRDSPADVLRRPSDHGPGGGRTLRRKTLSVRAAWRLGVRTDVFRTSIICFTGLIIGDFVALSTDFAKIMNVL